MELSNSCGDITHGEGPLRFNMTLSSDFPALSQQLTDPLQVQLQLNFSLIPKIPTQRIDSSMIVDISSTLLNQWTGGRSVQLEVGRAALPRQVVERIMSSNERLRTQVKLIFNGVTAAEWSPICESPIFQPCLPSE